MTKQSSQIVTKPLFQKEIKKLNKKIDDSVAPLKESIVRLDASVKRMAVAIVKIDDRLTVVETNMATKSDIDRVLTAMTDFAKKTDIVLQNQEVHRGYIHDHEARLIALEKRPAN